VIAAEDHLPTPPDLKHLERRLAEGPTGDLRRNLILIGTKVAQSGNEQ